MIEQEPLASAHTRALSDMSLSLGKEHKSKTSNSIVCIKQINTQLYRGMHRFGQKEGGTDGCRLFFDLIFSRKWCLLYGVYLPPWWTLLPKFKWILDRFQPVWRTLKILGSGNFCENKRCSLERWGRMPGTTCLHQQRLLQSSWGIFSDLSIHG